jgi:hypothetical protein
MTQNPPSSSGFTTSSTPPAPAADSTTAAAPATPDCSAPDSHGQQEAWRRTGHDQIGRGPYRISKSFVARRHIGISPVYHCFHLFAYLGACPSPDAAKALCAEHESTFHA